MSDTGGMRQRFKRLLFGLAGKEPEAVVVSFLSGEPARAAKMAEEVRGLVADRRHFSVSPAEFASASAWSIYLQLRRRFRRYRIGLAPVLFDGAPQPLRRAALMLAPTKILAYNERLERHHLKLSSAIASWLFLKGVPLDRIFLRPWTRLEPWPEKVQVLEGRPLTPGRPRIAIVSPYFPYPLSHGGAVRLFHLLREVSSEYDIFLFAFLEPGYETAPVLEFCSRVVLAGRRRYSKPRWWGLLPPEVEEYRSPVMHSAIERMRREYGFDLVQVEYTQLATFPGDILVEHDITFDLYRQVRERERTFAAWWNLWRWRRFEMAAARRFRRVVVMSEKDAGVLPAVACVIENGVDLERFAPEPETPGHRILFVGSFRHFPNVEAYRFFTGEVWPAVLRRFPEAALTVVAGPDHLLHWRGYTGSLEPPPAPGVRLAGFVRDLRPLYAEANLVVVPTTVSAGTNVKVLEAMAVERAVVSTSCGCAGLGLTNGESVAVADDATGFAKDIVRLLADVDRRRRMARAAREIAERRFGWRALGEKQRALYRELLAQTPDRAYTVEFHS